MMDKGKSYRGIIIEESLENKSVLDDVVILETKIEPVTESHKTPWIKQWTLHTIEIPENKASEVAQGMSHAIDSKHAGAWYIDFKTDKKHFIIFRDRVFHIDRKKEEYNKVKDYGLSLGIPEYQLDFSPQVEI